MDSSSLLPTISAGLRARVIVVRLSTVSGWNKKDLASPVTTLENDFSGGEPACNAASHMQKTPREKRGNDSSDATQQQQR
jgi:hypothetical protein